MVFTFLFSRKAKISADLHQILICYVEDMLEKPKIEVENCEHKSHLKIVGDLHDNI